MSTIKITIAADGSPTIDAVGFAGGACSLATKNLERKFAGADMARTEKPEMAMLDNEETNEERMYL